MKARITALRKLLEKNKLNALLVSNFHNILYLTGFKTAVPNEREVWALVTAKNTYVFVDGRNSEALYAHARSMSGITPRLISADHGARTVLNLEEIIEQEKTKTIGFEAEDLTFAEHAYFKKNIKNVRWSAQKNLIKKQRALKDEEEITKIRKAAQVADRCLEEVAKTIKVGQTEREIAFRIEYWFKKQGYDLSFETIVAADRNAAIPHYFTKVGNAKIKKGSLLLIDYGVCVDDYCSDTTRVLAVGKPSNELVNIYNKLLDAQEKTIEKIKVGVKLNELDEFVRQQLKNHNLPDFSHGTGHGVGLEVHEYPVVSKRSKDVAAVGQVFTIEPGVYMPGKYGMRIEDMVAVTSKGVEILTSVDKTLRVV